MYSAVPVLTAGSDVSPSVKELQNCLYLSYLLVHSDSKGTFLENDNYFQLHIILIIEHLWPCFLLHTDQHL